LASPVIAFEDSLIGPNTTLSGISITNSPVRMAFNHPDFTQGAMRDEDGSLTGNGPSLVFRTGYAFERPGCLAKPGPQTLVCPLDDYMHVRFHSEHMAAKGVGPAVVKGSGAELDMFSAERPEEHYRYQYLPRNERFAVQFSDLDLPNITFLDVTGTQEGYLALRIKYTPGYNVLVIDENDAVIMPKSGLSEINLSETNYWVDPSNSTLYLVVRADASTNFERKLTLFKHPLMRVNGADEQPSSRVAIHPTAVSHRAELVLQLEQSGPAQVAFYSLDGRRLDGGLELDLPAGNHRIALNPGNWPTGPIIYRVISTDGVNTGRLMKIR
jgi:hypothetical protein